jgi:hypothetical protein
MYFTCGYQSNLPLNRQIIWPAEELSIARGALFLEGLLSLQLPLFFTVSYLLQLLLVVLKDENISISSTALKCAARVTTTAIDLFCNRSNHEGKTNEDQKKEVPLSIMILMRPI